jgi:dipeptidyl aminopeptidase/acylaminoacyl peptidase
MRRSTKIIAGILGSLCISAGLARGDAKLDTTDIGPAGNTVGVSISPHHLHTAVLVTKGSRYAVQVDGVEGPRIDNLDWTGGAVFNATSGANWIGQIPVLFSDDGNHWVYCYQSGDDTVIILDGKEIARGPMQPQLAMPLTFSIGGKHFAYGYDNTIFMDGQAGPKSRYMPQLVFSPDGSRYAYTGTQPGGNAQWAVVDGKQVNYFGEIKQFSALNHLLAIERDSASNASILVMDGKPALKAAGIGQIWMSPDGKQIAMEITPTANSKPVLTVDGKVVPGTEGAGVSNVYFSPDGKRYAAHCSTTNTHFMIIDGKKGETYQSIPEQVAADNPQQVQWAYPMKTGPLPTVPAFTADSSKFVYTGISGNRPYLVVEDSEYDDYTGSALGLQPVLSPVGGHVGFIGQANNNNQAVVIDSKAQVIGKSGTGSYDSGLSFSPDGEHNAFLSGYTLYVDGQPMPGRVGNQQYVFSPDGKHIAYLAEGRMVIDGKIIGDPAVNQRPSNPIFSPDGQHFYWINTRSLAGSKDTQELYLDGKIVTHFDDIGLGHGPAFNYEITKDGVLTFITRTDGALKKFVVTPAADVNLTTVLATAPMMKSQP